MLKLEYQRNWKGTLGGQRVECEWYEGENEKKRWRGGRQEGRIEEDYGEGQLTLNKPHGNLLLLTDPSYGPLAQFKVLDMHSIFCSKP